MARSLPYQTGALRALVEAERWQVGMPSGPSYVKLAIALEITAPGRRARVCLCCNQKTQYLIKN